jgi:hypothetical protein
MPDLPFLFTSVKTKRAAFNTDFSVPKAARHAPILLRQRARLVTYGGTFVLLLCVIIRPVLLKCQLLIRFSVATFFVLQLSPYRAAYF